SLPPAAVCVVLRFRSSSGVERQQLRWVAAGVAGAVCLMVIGVPSGLGLGPNWISYLVFPGLLSPPPGAAPARGGAAGGGGRRVCSEGDRRPQGAGFRPHRDLVPGLPGVAPPAA